MTFPLSKLGFLLMKQLSRPLANFIKNEAKYHPFFRQRVCIPPARVYHWIEMRSKLHSKSRWKSISYAPLTEEEQVELGANLLGEVILFSLLSIILICEMNRQGDKKAVIERMKQDEMSNVVETVSDLISEVNELKKKVEKVEKKLQSSLDDILEFEDIRYEPYDEPRRRRSLWKLPLKRKRLDYDENMDRLDPFSP